MIDLYKYSIGLYNDMIDLYKYSIGLYNDMIDLQQERTPDR